MKFDDGKAGRLRARLTIGLFFLSALPGTAAPSLAEVARPFLWMIDTESPAFLFGTIHSTDDRVATLPDVVEAAFQASEAIYTEIPLDAETTARAGSAVMMSDGRTLPDVLPADLYRRADAYLTSRGLPIQVFHSIRVDFFAVQLQMLDELQDMLTKEALDAAIYHRAEREGKDARALETIEEQIGAFDALTERERIELLRATLDHVESLEATDESPIGHLVRLYLDGDENAFVDAMFEYFDPDDPFTKKFVDTFILERNVRMADRIDAWLEEEVDRVHFFAVGTLHFPMEGGLLSLLREKGYEIVRLEAGDADIVRERTTAVATR